MTHQAEGTPRWVKVFGVVALVVVVVFVILLVTGRGNHGPGRHALAGGAGTAPASVPEGHTPAAGAHTQP